MNSNVWLSSSFEVPVKCVKKVKVKRGYTVKAKLGLLRPPYHLTSGPSALRDFRIQQRPERVKKCFVLRTEFVYALCRYVPFQKQGFILNTL